MEKNSIKFIHLLMFLKNYLSIFIFFLVSVALSIFVFFLPYLLSSKSYDKEKLSSYDCGFSPFEDTKNEFDIKFYIIAILFIIFDLEIGFLFPFSLCLENVAKLGLFSMYFFLIILTVGFIYEWKKGALDWD